MEENIQLYLVSDSTGETVTNVARSAVAQFDNLKFEENLWTLIRTKSQIDKLAASIIKKKGIVMYTIANVDLQDYLRETCSKLGVLAIPVLAGVISTLSSYFGVKPSNHVGRQHTMNEEYFSRISAINFALSHDDGQANSDINSADIILVGPSRTSKSPTCIYLAYRGYKAANIPFVSAKNFPTINKGPLIVGLTINPERLVEIRKNRILNLGESTSSNYIDYENILNEVNESRKFFKKNDWPIIDVTRKSVEETAANIIKLFEQQKLEH